jgi:hypothetical protein
MRFESNELAAQPVDHVPQAPLVTAPVCFPQPLGQGRERHQLVPVDHQLGKKVKFLASQRNLAACHRDLEAIEVHAEVAHRERGGIGLAADGPLCRAGRCSFSGGQRSDGPGLIPRSFSSGGRV